MKRVALALVCAAALCATSVFAQDQEKAALRFVVFNVEYGAWANPEQIGEALKAYSPDVVGFNEVPQGDWTKRVGAVLGCPYAYTGLVSSANHFDKYKSIASRYPISDLREVMLDAPGGWNPASAVGATFEVNGKKIAFYSTHICFNKNEEDHAKQIADAVKQYDVDADIVVIGGDFNCLVDHTSGIKHFLDAGFKSMWLELKIDTTDLFTYSAVDPKDVLGVIDHLVFKGDAEATDGGIVEFDKPLADHKPVWLEIKF